MERCALSTAVCRLWWISNFQNCDSHIVFYMFDVILHKRHNALACGTAAQHHACMGPCGRCVDISLVSEAFVFGLFEGRSIYWYISCWHVMRLRLGTCSILFFVGCRKQPYRTQFCEFQSGFHVLLESGNGQPAKGRRPPVKKRVSKSMWFTKVYVFISTQFLNTHAPQRDCKPFGSPLTSLWNLAGVIGDHSSIICFADFMYQHTFSVSASARQRP